MDNHEFYSITLQLIVFIFNHLIPYGNLDIQKGMYCTKIERFYFNPVVPNRAKRCQSFPTLNLRYPV